LTRIITDPVKYQPEIDLLLCAAQVTIGQETVTRMCRLLRLELDWEFLFQLAHAHGILPLLHKRLEEHCGDLMPPTPRHQLHDLFEQNARRNLLMTAELLKLLRLLQDRELPVIPYKGPVMAAFVYGDLALRRADDLDILVKKRDAWRALELLRGLGFESSVPVAREQMPVFFKSECDLFLVHKQTRLVVELHWAIAPPFYGFELETEDLWNRLDRVDLGGTAVPTLSREDLLLVLCAHGSKHFWERLEWICGIAELAHAEVRLDWESVMSQATRLHSERMLLLGLALAHDLSGAEIPATMLQRIRASAAVTSLARMVQKSLFSAEPVGLFCLTLFRLHTRERVLDRIRYCLVRTWTPTYEDLEFLRLPPSLFSLYYLVRPLRLALAFGLRSLKRIVAHLHYHAARTGSR
jgi:hypothetical protein